MQPVFFPSDGLIAAGTSGRGGGGSQRRGPGGRRPKVWRRARRAQHCSSRRSLPTASPTGCPFPSPSGAGAWPVGGGGGIGRMGCGGHEKGDTDSRHRLVSSRLANLQRLLWSNVQCATLSSKKAKERPCVEKKRRKKTAHLLGKETPRLGHLLGEDHGGRGSRPGGPGGKSISKK